jgi:hypothetical protein
LTSQEPGQKEKSEKGINRFFEQCEEAIQGKFPSDKKYESIKSPQDAIIALLNRGVALMRRIVDSTANKKDIIIKKLIHCGVRLLKSEALLKDSNAGLNSATLVITILTMLDWNEFHLDALILNESR